MDATTLVLIAIAIVGYGAVSRRAQSWPVTPPMVFVAFGLLISPAGLGLVDLDLDSRFIQALTELTLIVILFTDAARIDLRLLLREHDLPQRLLLVGMPLTALLGFVAAMQLFPQLSPWSALVLAIMLTPTDAALGQSVVSSPHVPVRIRQALNVESGLNDGIAVPGLLIALSLSGAGDHQAPLNFWLRFAALQVTIGPLVGAAVGYIGGRLIEKATRSGWMNHTFQQLCALGVALLAFGLAELLSGSGFIAAFCAGLVIGNASRSVCTCLYEFGEAEGQLLALLIFMIFGAVLVPPALQSVDWRILAYAGLSLTVVRMLPVIVSLIGTRLKWETVGFLGWFGPRGIASILFGLLVMEETQLPGSMIVFPALTITVLISVYAHGLSAYPASRAYGRRVGPRDASPDRAELMEVEEMPLRHSAKLG